MRFYQPDVIVYSTYPTALCPLRPSSQLALSPSGPVERRCAVARRRHVEGTLLRPSSPPSEPLRSPREQHSPQRARPGNSRTSVPPPGYSSRVAWSRSPRSLNWRYRTWFLLVASVVKVDLRCHIDGENSTLNKKIRQRRENGMILIFLSASYQLILGTLSGPSREQSTPSTSMPLRTLRPPLR